MKINTLFHKPSCSDANSFSFFRLKMSFLYTKISISPSKENKSNKNVHSSWIFSKTISTYFAKKLIILRFWAKKTPICSFTYKQMGIPFLMDYNTLEHTPPFQIRGGSYAPMRYLPHSVLLLFYFCRCLFPVRGHHASPLPQILYYGRGLVHLQSHISGVLC